MKFHTAAPDGFYCLLRAKTLGIRADTELTRKLILKSPLISSISRPTFTFSLFGYADYE